MTLDKQIDALVAHTPDFWQLDACGVTRTERQIPALMHGAAQPPTGERIQLVLIGGLSGTQEDTDAALAALQSYCATPGLSERVGLSAVPCGNPDGLALATRRKMAPAATPAPATRRQETATTTPIRRPTTSGAGSAFKGRTWRSKSGSAPARTWQASAPCLQQWPQLCSELNASTLAPDSSLLGALATGEPNLLPPVPGLRLTCAAADLEGELAKLWTLLAQAPDDARSATRSALQTRVARSPLAVARILADVYGHELDPVIYTQGVAVSGRLRLAQLDPDGADPAADIEAIVAPYMSGAKPWFPAGGAGGANLAGLVWADELAAATGNEKYADLLVQAADRYRSSHDNGVPTPSNPTYQVEDMFFTAAVLGRAFKLTGDEAYLNILTRFLLDAGVQQADGLFWHDRRTPFYWGRGNGFAALSYAETLTYLPDNHPQRAAVLAIHRRHLQALRGVQHRSGMWRQLIDGPGSYPEMTVTCMVGYALARGLRRGWLDADHRDPLLRAWLGVAARIDDHGGLVDVCTGTGVQQSRRDYLDRPAIFGPDERGGALSLWFVTEMEQFLREN